MNTSLLSWDGALPWLVVLAAAIIVIVAKSRSAAKLAEARRDLEFDRAIGAVNLDEGIARLTLAPDSGHVENVVPLHSRGGWTRGDAA